MTTAPSPALVLEGRLIRLEPLGASHADDLAQFAFDPDLWATTQKRIVDRADLDAYLAAAATERERGQSVPFAVIDRATNRAIGSTRYSAIDVANRHLEIGWTWLARGFHGTGVNSEMKYLMLRHAFEDLAFVRVEFKANAANERSRAALRKLGAREEGVFRKWRIDYQGRFCDTAWYSILDDEWPAIRAALERR